MRIARRRLRHRHTLHLEARLDDVAERKGGPQTLAVAGSRLLGVTADERAVGEEVVREVLGARIAVRPSSRSCAIASARSVSPMATST